MHRNRIRDRGENDGRHHATRNTKERGRTDHSGEVGGHGGGATEAEEGTVMGEAGLGFR